MNIKLYGLAPYDRSGKVRWLLDEMGIAHEDHWLDRESKEIEGAAFLKVNPLGRVPAIEIDGKPIFESGAICTYLADLYADQGMAPSVQSPERAEYLQWMFLAVATIDPFVTRIMIIEDIPPGEVFNTKEATLLNEVRDVSQVLNQALSGKDYLVANRFSAADICVGYQLVFCSLWPEFKTVMDEYPHLNSYLERLKARPAAIKSKIFSFPV